MCLEGENEMGLNLGSTVLFVVCVGFTRQLGNCFSVFQSTVQHYGQQNAIHSSRSVTERDSLTNVFERLPRFGESSAVEYGFPDGVDGKDENNKVNLAVREIPEVLSGPKTGKGILDSFLSTNLSASSRPEILEDNDGMRLQGPADLLTGVRTNNRGIIHQDPPLTPSSRRRAETTNNPRQNKERNQDIRLRYFSPTLLKGSNSAMLLQGNEYTSSENNSNNNGDSRLNVFRNFTLSDIPLKRKKEKQTKITDREGILQRQVDSDESNIVSNLRKKSINNHELLIRNFPPIQTQIFKRALMSVLKRKKRQDDLRGIADSSDSPSKSADIFRFDKAKKRLVPKQSVVSGNPKLKTASSLGPYLNFAGYDTTDENLLDSVAMQMRVQGTRKPWGAGTTKNKNATKVPGDDAGSYLASLEKEYALMKREAKETNDREKRARALLSKTGDDSKIRTRQVNAHRRARDSYFRDDMGVEYYDFETVGEHEPDDQLLDFIIASNKIRPEDFNIHSTFADIITRGMHRERRTTKDKRLPVKPVRFREITEEIVIPWGKSRGHVTPPSNPYSHIPGFITDDDERTVSHGIENTGQKNIYERIGDHLFQAHIEDAIEEID